MATITQQDLYNKIDDIIKVSPAATDTTKLQGYLHRELLKLFADAIFQQQNATTTLKFPWSVPITSGPFNGQSFNTDDLVTGLYQLLHPATPPRASLINEIPVREIGANTAVTLSYSFAPGSSPIDHVFVNGQQVPNTPISGTQSTSTQTDTDTVFSMSATDLNGLSATATTQVKYRSRFFLFTSNQRLATLSDTDLSNLLHTQNGILVDNRFQSGDLTPNNEFYYIAYENSLGVNPIIKVNGYQDTSPTAHSFTYNNSQGANQNFTIFCGENLLTGLYHFDVS